MRYTIIFNEDTWKYEILEYKEKLNRRKELVIPKVNIIDEFHSTDKDLIEHKVNEWNSMLVKSTDDFDKDEQFVVIYCRTCHKYFKMTSHNYTRRINTQRFIPVRCLRHELYNRPFNLAYAKDNRK